MRIGLDFDNTIISYDALFYQVALEQDLIPEELKVSKVAVRNHLRHNGQETTWVKLQGLVYGSRINEASTYPGVRDFIQWATNGGHIIMIVSHRTKYPVVGQKINLHEAARGWISCHLQRNDEDLIHSSQVYFEVTKEEKLSRIGALGCDVFLDDLPEILLAQNFPPLTRPVLFDPTNNHKEANFPLDFIIHSWPEFTAYIDDFR